YQAGGLFDAQSDGLFYYAGGVATLLSNEGVLRKSAGSGVSQFSLPFNNNSGTVEAQSGTLFINTPNFNNQGTISAATGGSLKFGGNVNLSTNSLMRFVFAGPDAAT